MQLIKRTGNLLDLAEQGVVDVLVHQANLFHTFGSGIARQIAIRMPYAAFADSLTVFGDTKKLGHYTLGLVEGRPAVVNLYSQPTLAPSHTSYDAMVQGLTQLRDDFDPLPQVETIGFPYGMGCGLADGDWDIVEPIIKTVFRDSRFTIMIVKLLEPK